jgi:hypothetical protein
MEQRVFAYSLIIEGTTEKELQFIRPLSQFTAETLVSLNKKCIFEYYRVLSKKHNLYLGLVMPPGGWWSPIKMAIV